MDVTNAPDMSKAIVVYVPRSTEDEHNTSLPPPIRATPLRMILPSHLSNNPSDAGPSSGLIPIKRGRGRPKGSKNMKTGEKKPKIHDPNSKVVKSCPGFVSGITEEERQNGNQELVDLVLRRFDGVRRRLTQVISPKGILTTAFTNCINLGVRTNLTKRIGDVPGIHVGDIFYFWGEMCLVGLHTQMVAGIDYVTDGHVATSVVTSGHYDDETHEFDTLVYTGHGGIDKNGLACDQSLKRGNLALAESLKKGSGVRVIRGEEDPRDKKKKIYVYDGIYIVTEQRIAKGKSGFDEYKFRLVKEPGQPSAYATWRSVETWKKNGMADSRKGLLTQDLAIGAEIFSVPVVNELDVEDKTFPADFSYTRYLVNSNTILDLTTDRSSLGCKTCRGRSCTTKDLNCICVRKNGGDLPYLNQILVCRKPAVYECGQSCPCLPDCINRVVQRGLQLQVEVFKTENCGWGLRSWEPIRAGTFICEFAGFSKMRYEIEEDDDYVFDSCRVYNSFVWNYEPELVSEDPTKKVSEVYNLPSPILISARRFGNVGRFMNHSCSPNVFWQPIEYELNGEFYFRVGFFAMKHIPPLMELTYDYGVSVVAEEVGEDGGQVFRGKKVCLCGSVKCRGSFG